MLKSSSKSFKSISTSRLCDQQYSSVEQKGILGTLSSVTEAFLIFSPEISKKNIQQKCQRELSHKNIKQKYQREKSNATIKDKYQQKKLRVLSSLFVPPSLFLWLYQSASEAVLYSYKACKYRVLFSLVPPNFSTKKKTRLAANHDLS